MALTTTVRGPNVNIVGSLKQKFFNCTFTGVTGGEVKTGLSNVISARYTPQTTEDYGLIYPNSATASATEDDFGSCYIDGVTSGDIGILEVIGV